MRRALPSFAMSVVLLWGSVALADPPTCGEAPGDSEVRRRLEILSGAVRAEEPPIRRWWTSFAVLHGTMMSAAIVLAATAQDEGFRNEMLVGTTSSALALLTLVAFSPALMGAGDTLGDLPEDTPEARLHKMRVAEDLMQRSASTVDFLHSWLPATGTALYLAAAASTLLLGFERVSGAYSHVIGGVVLGFGRVLLHPRGSRDRWSRYASAYEDADCEPAETDEALLRWRFQPAGLGLGFRVDF